MSREHPGRLISCEKVDADLVGVVGPETPCVQASRGITELLEPRRYSCTNHPEVSRHPPPNRGAESLETSRLNSYSPVADWRGEAEA